MGWPGVGPEAHVPVALGAFMAHRQGRPGGPLLATKSPNRGPNCGRFTPPCVTPLADPKLAQFLKRRIEGRQGAHFRLAHDFNSKIRGASNYY